MQTLSFTECLALYANFRSTHSIDKAHLEEALGTLLPEIQEGSQYATRDLFETLCTRGSSPFSREELAHCLGSLTGLITEEEQQSGIPALLNAQVRIERSGRHGHLKLLTRYVFCCNNPPGAWRKGVGHRV